MTLLVKKYGGTSLGNLERIQRLADSIAQAYKAGHSLVIVLSAMGGETDRLLGLAHTLLPSGSSYPREQDMLLTTGEQISIALMSMALKARGVPAESYTGWQAGIATDSRHKKAAITHINTDKLKAAIAIGRVPVVAGFQGIDAENNITTLGRGGSDITAVSLAAALNAEECHIYTDVKGVYTADPRIVSDARLLEHITFEEMLELASLGAKVLQVRAVEFASKYNVKVRVLPALPDDKTLLADNAVSTPHSSLPSSALGTLISCEDTTMEQPLVSGVTYDSNQSQLILSHLPNEAGIGHKIFEPIANAGIVVDMIVQTIISEKNKDCVDISFTVPRDEYDEAHAILKKIIAENFPKTEITGNKKVVKLSVVGVGMRSHMGVASQLFGLLGDEGINILLVTTSEIKISVLIEEKYLELGLRALHTGYTHDDQNSGDTPS